MKNSPKVSVIVPVYNAEMYLNSTLNALLNQTLQEIEIVCIDDGSTDDSGKLLIEAAKQDPKITVINQANKGAFHARMSGIKVATGTYIAFCDADDKPDITIYERLFQLAEKTRSDLAVCSYKRVNQDGVAKKEMTTFGCKVIDSRLDKGWMTAINTALWNKLFKKSVLQKCKVPKTPPRIMEDAYLLYSIMDKIDRVAFTDEALYTYKMHDGSQMSRIDSSEISDLFDSWQELRNNSCDENLIDLGAFIHLGVSMSLLLVKNGYEQEAKSALNRIAIEFSTINESPYLSSYYIKKHPELAKVKFARTVNKLSLLIPAMSLYSKIEKQIGLAVKW